MAAGPDDGRVWGRPESLDTLGRLPGRRRRWLGTVVGVAAIAAGAWVGFTGSAGGTGPLGGPAASPTATAAPVVVPTCASIGVRLDGTRIPAESVVESSIVRLSRAADDGTARLLVPQAYVLRVTPNDGGIQMSVLVRTDDAETVEAISASSADGSLVAAVLYDLDPLQVLEECRRGP